MASDFQVSSLERIEVYTVYHYNTFILLDLEWLGHDENPKWRMFVDGYLLKPAFGEGAKPLEAGNSSNGSTMVRPNPWRRE